MMKEKITFRMNGIIEKYEGILESAEKEISQCEEKIRILIKNNQKDSEKKIRFITKNLKKRCKMSNSKKNTIKKE